MVGCRPVDLGASAMIIRDFWGNMFSKTTGNKNSKHWFNVWPVFWYCQDTPRRKLSSIPESGFSRVDLHFCWAINCGLIDWVLIMIGSIYQLLISMLDARCLMRAWWFTAHSSWPMGARPPALAMSLNPWKITGAWSSKHQAPGHQATIKRSKY